MSRPAGKRPVRTMRRAELEAEGKRLGVENMERYTVKELRFVVGAKIAKGAF